MIVPGPRRVELKVTAPDEHLAEVLSWLRLHPDGFRPAFPPRQVNNIYFDTVDLASYGENLDGGTSRRKLRLRWYGGDDDTAHGVIEAKCKRGGIGWKVSQALDGPLRLSETSWSVLLQRIRTTVTDELSTYFSEHVHPVILNRYLREYLVTQDDRIRVTVDHTQRLYDQRFGLQPNLRAAMPGSTDLIIEFKAPREERDRLMNVSQQFPLRITKSSKYVHSVQRVLSF